MLQFCDSASLGMYGIWHVCRYQLIQWYHKITAPYITLTYNTKCTLPALLHWFLTVLHMTASYDGNPEADDHFNTGPESAELQDSAGKQCACSHVQHGCNCVNLSTWKVSLILIFGAKRPRAHFTHKTVWSKKREKEKNKLSLTESQVLWRHRMTFVLCHF